MVLALSRVDTRSSSAKEGCAIVIGIVLGGSRTLTVPAREHPGAAKELSLTSASGDAETVTTGDQVPGLNALTVAPLAPNLSPRVHAEADEAVGSGVVAVSDERGLSRRRPARRRMNAAGR